MIQSNSVLTTVASIHATILGIVFAVLIAFYIYSYQVISQIHEELSDIRTTISKLMQLPIQQISSGEAYSQYIANDGNLDLPKLRTDLHRLIPPSFPDYLKKRFEKFDMDRRLSIQDTKRRGETLINIINLLSITYPYSQRANIDDKSTQYSHTPKRLEYDDKWKEELISINGFLAWLWKGQKAGIVKLINEYQGLHDEERHEEYQAQKRRIIEERERMGKPITDEAVEEMLSPFRMRMEYNGIVRDFFRRVVHIEDNFVPHIKDLSYKMNLYRTKFNTRSYVVAVLIITFFILIGGIFVPLFIHLYWQPPYIKSIELMLLVISLAPYAVIILWFLAKVLRMKIL